MTQAIEHGDGWETATCPKCGCAESHVVYQGQDHLYHTPGNSCASECVQCGLWFQNPRPTSDRLVDLYPSSYGPHASSPPSAAATAATRPNLRVRHAGYLARRLGYTHLSGKEPLARRLFSVLSERKRNWKHGVALTPHFVPDGQVLEIGCASGGQLERLRQLGWQHLSGIELVRAAAEEARAKGFKVECGQVEDVLSKHADDYFDVVLSSMVLEHLYNPFEVVRMVAAKLKPGGQFLFSTISRDSLDARIFGSHWAGFDFPRHMVHFRIQDIRDMLAGAFEDVECFHQNAPVDFLRSATWRNRPIDRVYGALAKSPLGKPLSGVLARLGMTTRVSFRCRRKTACGQINKENKRQAA